VGARVMLENKHSSLEGLTTPLKQIFRLFSLMLIPHLLSPQLYKLAPRIVRLHHR